MAFVVLDIGAGGFAFAKYLRRNNPDHEMLVLCGEPQWGIGPFFAGISRRRTERLIRWQQTGIWPITARYADFNVPDESLDMVTLNAPHPFSAMGGFSKELERCLKPGGLYFSSHPKISMGRPPENFEVVGGGRWEHSFDRCTVADVPIVFPQSPFIYWNIIYHRSGLAQDASSSYVYHSGINPHYMLYRKPK